MEESEKTENNVKAKEIIGQVLHHVGMKAPTFAKEIGINYQRVFDLQSGRTKKFNPGVVNKIVERFPDINKNYLYTGEGELILGRQPQAAPLPCGDASMVTLGASQLAEIMAMNGKMLGLLQTITEREAVLAARAEELNRRERELNQREHELNQREHELNQRS